MATVKKSKKRIIVPICIVLVIAIVAGSIFAFAKSGSGEEVELHTITTDDIFETVSLTGEVSAGLSKEYKVGTVATVKEVNVKVGDNVKKGDVLATFDVSELNDQVASLQSSYNSALSAYNSASKSQKTATENAKELKGEIASLEKKVKKLEKAASTTKKATTISTTKSTTTTKPSTSRKPITTNTTTTTTAPSSSTTTTTTTTTAPTSGGSVTIPTTPDYTSNIEELVASLTELNKTLTQITNDLNTLAKATELIANVVAQAIANGNFDSDVIAQEVGAALNQAVKEGIIDSTNLIIESGLAVKMVEAAVAQIDFQGITDAIMNSNNVTLTAAEIQLASKNAQYAIYKAQSNETVLDAQRTAVDVSKKALDTLKKQQAELSAGWTADFDGTITAVDITPGAQTTVLTSGITLENLDTMVATLSLSEYDVHKVKVGMPATITTAYGKYAGEVASIAPTATGGSDSSILDSVGSMAGISGLSSLTDSGAGVECQVSIKDTDENIIAGFDADVEIETGEYLGVVVVPIESIKLEKTGSYVYLYNEEDKTVTKTQIETGAVSDSCYEVTSGLKAGDRVISAPEATYEEDTFKVKVK
ncbi:MAG: biotin/lipoyl-binding protein [Eubacterium sp.]